ncbi:MAG TPA: hypothetical protein VF599_12670 [Pyrinomonadaceae bacterium]
MPRAVKQTAGKEDLFRLVPMTVNRYLSVKTSGEAFSFGQSEKS